MTTHATGNAVAGLEPRSVWEFFAGIAAVPRPSKREERIRKHVKGLATQHGLAFREDSVGNIVIDVPATPGHAKASITVLQAHLDMVCEKNATTQHNFDNEGISLVVETEAASGALIVRGDGTTLGADNGIGAALALAAATSPEVVHGPLELLFTVDEEEGMTGAKALSRESFRGRNMLNLDSEEEDTVYIGCAGGCDLNLSWTLNVVTPTQGAEFRRVSVTGLRGGHSGVNIHEGRANAIKLLARTLLRTPAGSLQLLSICGGSKRNAIPREATAVVAGPSASLGELERAGTEVAKEATGESFESEVSIGVQRVCDDLPETALSAGDTARVLDALMSLPSGVLGMHPKVAGLVETSNNLSTITMKADGSQAVIAVGLLPRSSSASRMRETLDQLSAIGRLAGAGTSTGSAYPGWSPNPDSPILSVCRRVYQGLFHEEPKVAAIHAGLECGIIGERVGEMDMVSLGPTIRGAHSPDERVYVASVERAWRYLVAVLAALARS